MSDNTRSETDGDYQDIQPQLNDFVERKCSVCGRKYGENEAPCHRSHVVSFERRLTTQNWLLARNPQEMSPSDELVVGADGISFEPLYSALKPLIQSESGRFDEYHSHMPYESQHQEWLAEVFRKDLLIGDRLVLGVRAGIESSEDRIKKEGKKVTPARVFAHLVFLDQYGLLPGFSRLRRGNANSLREICADHYDVEPDSLASEWVTKRRVDRSKVYSTTSEFKKEWNVELIEEYPASKSHPHSEYKPFDGTAILADHRDHNLVARRVKRQLHRLPDVDWVISPHIISSHSDDGSSSAVSSNRPVLGFDVGGFEYTGDGQRLRYLGIVTGWDESLFETYLQALHIGETAATGILVLPNRESIYDFLHFLKDNELTERPWIFPDSRDGYRSIPNVQALHDQLIRQIPLLDEMALVPRRKFLDEGVDSLADLVSVPTYA